MRGLVRFAALVTVAFVLGACDDDEPSGVSGPFDLTFEGDATFQTPHPDQAIYVAVVRTSNGAVVARQSGTVSSSADPAFSFTFANLLQGGTAYQVHYWIDSNFPPGNPTEGVCDPRANDHQWNVAVAAPTADVTITETHDASETMDVCATFAADLTFAGNATYNTPHPDHPIAVAVVRASDGLVVGRDDGTVSATADPAFSFSFPGVLVIGVAYEIHYWIDSNFGAGTLGTCDPPANDHQWNLAVATVTADVDITETHDAAATEDVCSSFP